MFVSNPSDWWVQFSGKRKGWPPWSIFLWGDAPWRPVFPRSRCVGCRATRACLVGPCRSGCGRGGGSIVAGEPCAPEAVACGFGGIQLVVADAFGFRPPERLGGELVERSVSEIPAANGAVVLRVFWPDLSVLMG